MIYFLGILAVYVSLLLFFRPAPESLKAPPLTFRKNFCKIRGSLAVGTIILLVFLLTSHFQFKETTQTLFLLLGMNNILLTNLTPMQFFTHAWVHQDWVHLLSNLSGVGLASLYERRVGTKRFLAVLSVGVLIAPFSVLFYEHHIVVVGISGGVMALAAGYFTDHTSMTTKEWLVSILGFAVLALAFSWRNTETSQGTSMVVDHVGHALGAVAGIIYCRFRPCRILSVP